jgi:Ca2+/Na+ antiporter
MMKRIVGLVVLVSMIAAACGGGIDREGSIKEIQIGFDVDVETANCIFDEINNEISGDRMVELNKDDVEPTAAEVNAVTIAMSECGSGASALLDTDELDAFAESLGIDSTIASCVIDAMGTELGELGVSGEDPDAELIGQVFAAVETCGG